MLGWHLPQYPLKNNTSTCDHQRAIKEQNLNYGLSQYSNGDKNSLLVPQYPPEIFTIYIRMLLEEFS